MNLRRGLWRITFVLAEVIAIFCAACAVVLVIEKHDYSQSYYREKYGVPPPPKGFVIERSENQSDIFDRVVEEERIAEELKHNFWANLSKAELVGLCILAGLGGGVLGFLCTWIIVWFGGLAVYKLIRWIILGFYDSQNKNICEKSKESEG